MKKKVAIVISICTILVTVGLGVLAFVFWGGRDDKDGVIANPDSLSYHTDNENQSESAQPEQSQQNNNQDRKTRLSEEDKKEIAKNNVGPVEVAKEITINLTNGEKLFLKFDKYELRFGVHCYLYTNDQQPNTIYYLNEKGEIREIDNLKKQEKAKVIFTKQQAMDKAREILRNYIGDSIDDYEIYDIDNQADGKQAYTFNYRRTYGEDGFITGENGRIGIHQDGDVTNCTFPIKSLYEKYDREKLDKITKEQIEEHVAYAIEKYYKNYSSYEVKHIWIRGNIPSVAATVYVWPEKIEGEYYTSVIEHVEYFL